MNKNWLVRPPRRARRRRTGNRERRIDAGYLGLLWAILKAPVAGEGGSPESKVAGPKSEAEGSRFTKQRRAGEGVWEKQPKNSGLARRLAFPGALGLPGKRFGAP